MFTDNNNQETPQEWCDRMSEYCTYICVGQEVGNTGTPHLQGYAEFKIKHRGTWYKVRMPNAHIERRKGTAMQAAEYCQKADKNFIEWGTISDPNPGKRSDLEQAIEILRTSGMTAVADEVPTVAVRYYRGLQYVQNTWRDSEPRIDPEVTVFWGQTGTGKTYLAHKRSPNAFFSWSNQWYDGYDGVSDIIIDEYNGEIQLGRLLRMLDRQKLMVPTKGGSINFNPRRIFITSHFHPENWYPEQQDRYPELARRLNYIHEFRRVLRADRALATEVGGNTGTPTSSAPPIFSYVDHVPATP